MRGVNPFRLVAAQAVRETVVERCRRVLTAHVLLLVAWRTREQLLRFPVHPEFSDGRVGRYLHFRGRIDAVLWPRIAAMCAVLHGFEPDGLAPNCPLTSPHRPQYKVNMRTKGR